MTNNNAVAGQLGAGKVVGSGGKAFGGALFSSGSSVLVRASSVSGNQAVGKKWATPNNDVGAGSGNGGGIYQGNGKLDISDTFFFSNKALGGGATSRIGDYQGAHGNGGGI